MEKPNIDNMWEMAIRIPDGSWGEHIISLQNKVIPAISKLKEECGVQWYCFLIHNNINGLPIPYQGLQFHIRFENTKNLSIDELKSKLPKYCEMIRKIESLLTKISGIDTSLLKGDDIQEAWKIIGESCEWIVEMLSAHKMVEEIPLNRMPQQIAQFQHFIENITMIGFQ